MIPAFAIVTLALLPFQAVSVWMRWPSARRIPVLYHRVLCRIVGVKVDVTGTLSRLRPLLVVSNHVSWLDISVVTSIAPVAFIAKREVASWPVFGLLAKLQRSIFVDRERKLKSEAINREIAERMLADDAVVLFAEGTSSDGKDVLPFRSALIGSAATVLTRSEDVSEVFIQPLAISYIGPSREVAAWHGDMDFFPHLLNVLRTGNIEVAVSWGEPVSFDKESDRKEIARQLERMVRDLVLKERAPETEEGRPQAA